MTILAPSILSADFVELKEQVNSVLEAGAEWIHVDVMDGHYVPNLTIGPMVVEALRRITEAPLDVHLMIEQPERYLEAFVKAGASRITVHVEATRHLDRLLNRIHELGAAPGVTLNPATPLCALEQILDLVEMTLVMSVNPGFGGQSYIPYRTDKIRRLRAMAARQNPEMLIEVDGGISAANIGEVVTAGGDVIVAGSAIFKASDPAEAVKKMLAAAEQALRRVRTRESV